MKPRWLIGVPLSIALHTALVLAVIALVRVEQVPTGLIVDLSAIVVSSDDSAARSSGAPAPVVTRSRASDGAAIPRSRTPREAPHAPAAAPVVDATPRREEPAPTPALETAVPAPTAPTSSDVSSLALTAEPDRTSAPGSVAHGAPFDGGATRATGSGTVAGGTTEPGATDAGGVGGDRIAALGVPGGGGAGSDYAVYYARLRQRIQNVLRYPPVARQRGVTGTVHLEIAIEPNGVIGAVSVLVSSSHQILDRAAVNAARAISRVPFPTDVRPRALRVRLPVVFELQ